MRKAINFNGRDFNAVMVETILDIYNTKVVTLTNDKYQKRVMFCKEYRFIFDVVDLGGVLMGDIKVQKKGSNGRYETIGKWVWSNGDFENFVIRTFFSVEEEEVFDNAKTAICNEFGSENVTVNGNEIIVKGETVTVVASYYGEDGNYCGDEWEMIYLMNDSDFGEVPTGFGYFGYTIEEILDYIKEGLDYVEEEVDDLGF